MNQEVRAVAMQDDNPSSPNRMNNGQTLVKFYNGSGSTIAAGVPLAIDLTDYSSAGVLPGEAFTPTAAATDTTSVCLGFNLASCPTGTWGWRVVRGRVDSVPCGSGVAAKDVLVGSTAAAAKVNTQSATYSVYHRPCAIALTAHSGGTCSVLVI